MTNDLAAARRTTNDKIGHRRELVFNAATAAFQMIPHYRATQRGQRDEIPADGKPPFYMGKCMTWAFDGAVVQRMAPQFYRAKDNK
jgi:hypothetical protein